MFSCRKAAPYLRRGANTLIGISQVVVVASSSGVIGLTDAMSMNKYYRTVSSPGESRRDYATREKLVAEERERFSKMAIGEKRKLYACGSEFVTLDKVPTWAEYKNKHRFRLFKKVSLKEPKFAVNEKFNEKVSVWRGDITKLEIDAIGNAANSSLMGGGGVDGCIHRSAGSLLKKECSTLNGCDSGDAKITSGYKLPAKHVIHTVGPMGEYKQKLESCYKTCLKLLKENKLRSLAMPCISTGIYGYPNDRAALVAIGTVRRWLETDDNAETVDRIIFCLFLQEDVRIYDEQMSIYFPSPEDPWFHQSSDSDSDTEDSQQTEEKVIDYDKSPTPKIAKKEVQDETDTKEESVALVDDDKQSKSQSSPPEGGDTKSMGEPAAAKEEKAAGQLIFTRSISADKEMEENSCDDKNHTLQALQTTEIEVEVVEKQTTIESDPMADIKTEDSDQEKIESVSSEGEKPPDEGKD